MKKLYNFLARDHLFVVIWILYLSPFVTGFFIPLFVVNIFIVLAFLFLVAYGERKEWNRFD